MGTAKVAAQIPATTVRPRLSYIPSPTHKRLLSLTNPSSGRLYLPERINYATIGDAATAHKRLLPPAHRRGAHGCSHSAAPRRAKQCASSSAAPLAEGRSARARLRSAVARKPSIRKIPAHSGGAMWSRRERRTNTATGSTRQYNWGCTKKAKTRAIELPAHSSATAQAD